MLSLLQSHSTQEPEYRRQEIVVDSVGMLDPKAELILDEKVPPLTCAAKVHNLH